MWRGQRLSRRSGDRFLSKYPEVHLELAMGEAPIDIVKMGFDAGIGTRDAGAGRYDCRSGDGTDEDRRGWCAGLFCAAAARRARPMISPSTAASNIAWPVTAPYSTWPFERNRKTRRISVAGRVIVNDTDLAVRAAVDGLGIAYTIESLAEPFLRSGQLIRILEDWSPPFEGLILYYPGRRQVPAALRALIDMIRTARDSASSRRSLQNPLTKD